MADPYILLFTNAATSIVVVIGTLTALWMNGSFANHASKASLEATNAELKKHISHMESKDAVSQQQILELQTTIENNFSRERIHLRFPLDPPSSFNRGPG